MTNENGGDSRVPSEELDPADIFIRSWMLPYLPMNRHIREIAFMCSVGAMTGVLGIVLVNVNFFI